MSITRGRSRHVLTGLALLAAAGCAGPSAIAPAAGPPSASPVASPVASPAAALASPTPAPTASPPLPPRPEGALRIVAEGASYVATGVHVMAADGVAQDLNNERDRSSPLVFARLPAGEAAVGLMGYARSVMFGRASLRVPIRAGETTTLTVRFLDDAGTGEAATAVTTAPGLPTGPALMGVWGAGAGCDARWTIEHVGDTLRIFAADRPTATGRREGDGFVLEDDGGTWRLRYDAAAEALVGERGGEPVRLVPYRPGHGCPSASPSPAS